MNPRRNRRILVVEDDPQCAVMYRAALRFAGFDVDIASDGVDALRAIDHGRPDLIVLDLHLPRLRGEAILSELSVDPELCRIPVVVVTGTDAPHMAAQAAVILRKPCDPDHLVAVVEERLHPAA
jgi:two-component system, sensor histidine kinase and response regulator